MKIMNLENSKAFYNLEWKEYFVKKKEVQYKHKVTIYITKECQRE